MKVDLSHRVALVTGAATGIGRALAEAIAGSGCGGLMLTDRDPAVIALAEALGARHVLADLAAPDAVDRITAKTIAAFGRIDALANVAGLTTRGSVVDGTEATWDSLMSVNARAPFFLMQAVIRDILRREAAGSVVNNLSINAHCGIPELGIYAGTKGALATLTKNAANAHLGDGIRVNGINLGWVATPSEDRMQRDILGKGPGWQAQVAATRPWGRLLQADEAARLALFLLSDSSAPLTGALIDLEQHVTGAPG
ncbi:oxidoreductase [Roseisalinus antarcticus]|uniref:2,5-dichloro-2,5-cyclohexadiene-1,4-diol dehydrogenase n=1 Tax=Roseisalinus antarcticus TaxID=254357 RepID=A0A1Y5TIE5_9RHOB|nr:oxidoreductase [Roseisalinus antarcticus]SLN64696.1 2,5-dichloro-2,5-cyclohexadiene-1,4-diol dehydrogenase [Roseisalinus antarcticus]